MKPQGERDGRRRAEHRYPDFLCIGAQKAGTSWIDANLRRHPRLWLPPVKELQFFSHLHVPATRRWTDRHRRERGTALLERYLERNPSESWDWQRIARLADLVAGPITDGWYGRMFALAGPGQLCGEVTPDYCTIPESGIAHVVKLSPDIRVILSLRDPIERSWSHLRMIAQRRGIADPAELEAFARKQDQLARGDYPAIVARWRKYVPEERFLVVFMDDIVADPYGVLEKLCGFLGVPYRQKLFHEAPDPVHVGRELDIPAPVLAVLKEALRPVYDAMVGLYPEIGARWKARHY